MLSLALPTLALALSPLPQQPVVLGPPKAISHPGGPMGAFFSADGSKIFSAEGAAVVALDRAAFSACELGTGPCYSNSFEIAGSRTQLDAPILDIEERAGVLFVAGGDAGAFRLDPQAGGGYQTTLLFQDQPAAGVLTRRWCFDVELTNGGTHLLALFAATGDSELKVINLQTGLVENTVVLPSGRGYAVDSYGFSAYLAMGSAGLWKVNDWRTSTTAVQGPPDLSASGSPYTTIRDVAIAFPHRYLYAAGDSFGLIEVDLTKTWNSVGSYRWGMPGVGSCGFPPAAADAYGHRVEVVHDATWNRLVVALETHGGPVAAQEWGPYRTFTSFRWDEQNPYVDPSAPPDVDCGSRIVLYERDLNGTAWAQKVLDTEFDVLAALGGNTMELMQDAAGRYWVMFAEYILEAFQRDGSGNLAYLPTNSMPNVYRDGWFGLGALALRDPDVLLFGRDSDALLWGTPGIVPVAGGGIAIEEIAPPCPVTGMALTYGAQWTQTENPSSPDYPWEWGVSNGFMCPPLTQNFHWPVHRMDVSDLPDSTFRWVVPYPVDPVSQLVCLPPPGCPGGDDWHGWTTGRGYVLSARDPRSGSDLLAVTRRSTVHGALLYSRSAVQAAALAMLGETCGTSDPSCPPVISPGPFVQLNTQPALSQCSCYNDEIGLARSMHTQFFSMVDHLGQPRWVLGVAAGWVTEHQSPDYGKAQLVFFDVTNCNHPSDPGCQGMQRSTVLIDPLPGEGGAYAFSFDQATIGGVPYLIVGDWSGRALVADATNLFNTGAPPVQVVASWTNQINRLDGLRDRVTIVRYDPLDLGTTGKDGQVYVASNRLGLVRLDLVKDPLSNAVTLALDTLEETPGQVVGMAFGEVNGKRRLIVTDHLPTGIRAYGEY